MFDKLKNMFLFRHKLKTEPAIWKDTGPSILSLLPLAVGITAVIKLFAIREDYIHSLPLNKQLIIRRRDKRIHYKIKRKRRPILRHSNIYIRRSRVLSRF